MGRILWAGLLACAVLGLIVAPVSAEDDTQGEIEKLRQEVETLKSTMLEQDISTYLTETEGWKGVQGGGDGMRGVTIHANFCSNFITSVGVSDPDADKGVLNGVIYLEFDFQVTDNLEMFADLFASTDAYFPDQFTNGGGGFIPIPATLAGLLDGIGVDGTEPVKVGGGVRIYQAGIKVTQPIANGEFHWEIGELDPRRRYLQNAYADDGLRRFVNNQFADNSSVPWLTGYANGGAGAISLGFHAWWELGAQKQHTINAGWFNMPGTWFSNGQFLIQYSWKGEVKGRAMNVRVMGWYATDPGASTNGSNDESTGGGAHWDWRVTDKVGIWVNVVANNKNQRVPTGFDGSVGALIHGLGSRADDRLGIAVGFIDPNTDIAALANADLELVVEVYYMYAAQDGKLQITPYLQYINNPGGGTDFTGWEDALFLLGLRIFVPF
jgi:hypothetical protein